MTYKEAIQLEDEIRDFRPMYPFITTNFTKAKLTIVLSLEPLDIDEVQPMAEDAHNDAVIMHPDAIIIRTSNLEFARSLFETIKKFNFGK